MLEPETIERNPAFASRLNWVLEHRPDLASLVSFWDVEGQGRRRLLSLLRGHRVKMLLHRMLDEAAFLSDHGIRSVSKYHLDKPFTLDLEGQRFSVGYVPGESTTRAFGGNSNWRGPLWMPVNFMLIEALYGFYRYYGDEFQVEFPVGSGQTQSLKQIADELTTRQTRLFLRGPDGRRPAMGTRDFVHDDPHFRDRLMFHEYFHGDTGEGIGASHQTGWTGLIALLLHGRMDEDPTRMDMDPENGGG